MSGAKLSTVLNCLRCQIVHSAKLSAVPNCLRCQIVRGAKLSAVPNCPVLNCPRIHILKELGQVLEEEDVLPHDVVGGGLLQDFSQHLSCSGSFEGEKNVFTRPMKSVCRLATISSFFIPLLLHLPDLLQITIPLSIWRHPFPKEDHWSFLGKTQNLNYANYVITSITEGNFCVKKS